jgi:hypothetical protein
VGGAGAHVRDPQRLAARIHQRLDHAPELAALAGEPGVDLTALLRSLRLGQPIGRYQGAVQNQIGASGRLRRLKRLLQIRGLVREDLEHLVTVAVRGGAREAEAGPEPLDIDLVAQPRQAEKSVLERGEQARAPSCATSAPLHGQQSRDVPDGFSIDIERESVRVHAEPFLVGLYFGRNPSTSGCAFCVADIRDATRCAGTMS